MTVTITTKEGMVVTSITNGVTSPGGTAPGGTAPGGTAPGGTAPVGTAPVDQMAPTLLTLWRKEG